MVVGLDEKYDDWGFYLFSFSIIFIIREITVFLTSSETLVTYHHQLDEYLCYHYCAM